MKCLRGFFTAVLLLLVSTNVMAAGFKVIANPSVAANAISAEDLKEVFLQEKSALSDGSRVAPVLAKGGPAHEAFVKRYLGKTNDTLQTYYRSLVFTGKGSMPKTLGTDAELVSHIAKTKGAIGYVSADVTLEGVKTLEVK
jgi:hypothetical protein